MMGIWGEEGLDSSYPGAGGASTNDVQVFFLKSLGIQAWGWVRTERGEGSEQKHPPSPAQLLQPRKQPPPETTLQAPSLIYSRDPLQVCPSPHNPKRTYKFLLTSDNPSFPPSPAYPGENPSDPL